MKTEETGNEYLKECIRILAPSHGGERVLFELNHKGQLRGIPMADLEILINKPPSSDVAPYLRWRRRMQKYDLDTSPEGVSKDKDYRKKYYKKKEGTKTAPSKLEAIEKHIAAIDEHVASIRLLLSAESPFLKRNRKGGKA